MNRHGQCESDEDAVKMAEDIIRELGFPDVQKGKSNLDIRYEFDEQTLKQVAVNAERISRWARAVIKDNNRRGK